MSDERASIGCCASRRRVFAGAGAVGAAAVLTACGANPEDSFEVPDPPAGADGPDSGTVLASIDEVEVGGGVIVAEHNVVVTQPSEGEFRGFSATCTHEGCVVTDVVDGTIHCSCHDSLFSVEDGAVVQKANTLPEDADQDPLPAVEIEVSGSEIVVA